MTQPYQNNAIHGAVELLKTNGFDGLAEAVTILLNARWLPSAVTTWVQRKNKDDSSGTAAQIQLSARYNF